MSPGALDGWGCVGSSELQPGLQSLFFSGLCPWNLPCLQRKKWEVLSFSLLLSRGQRNHRASQQPLALIFTHGTLCIVGQFGFWFIGADEHKAWRKPQCCCCTQAEHPRALHGPCVLGQELRGFSENDILMEVRLLWFFVWLGWFFF